MRIETDEIRDNLKYLALLARDYPSQAAAASEIISNQALLKEAGIEFAILSNNRSPVRVEKFCKPLKVGYVGHAGKPGTRGFHEAMARYGVNAGETAMLGDKLLTDTLGARRSGVLMLMVEPRGGAVGAWNHVLHALQQPFKAASAHDERKKH